jgi:excisionase family DNA binding protein
VSALLNLAEVAARLGISRTSAWRLVCRDGEIPSVRVTSSIRRVDADDLERWIDERRERPAPAVVVPLQQRERP